MEKFLFRLLTKMFKPQFVALMLLSFFPIMAIPFVQYFFKPSPVVIYALSSLLLPVISYLFLIMLLGIIYAIQISSKYANFPAVNQIEVLTIKSVARALKISPRAAYFMLEAAERGNEYKKEGTKAANFKYLPVNN